MDDVFAKCLVIRVVNCVSQINSSIPKEIGSMLPKDWISLLKTDFRRNNAVIGDNNFVDSDLDTNNADSLLYSPKGSVQNPLTDSWRHDYSPVWRERIFKRGLFWRYCVDKLTSLSLSIGGLAGVATFLAVGPLAGIFLIWAATVPWAVFFLLGADQSAVCKNITCSLFGVFMAWVTALMLTEISPDTLLGFPAMAAFTVAVSVVVLCLAANLPQLATIPCSVVGYSLVFAYLLQTPNMLTKEVLLGASITNPLLVISISIVVGTYLGVGSVRLSEKLQACCKK
jgi:Protein of unknown function (DUF1097)